LKAPLIESQEVLAKSATSTIELRGKSFHCGILAEDFAGLLAVQRNPFSFAVGLRLLPLRLLIH
jgi:hypothetical protein